MEAKLQHAVPEVDVGAVICDPEVKILSHLQAGTKLVTAVWTAAHGCHEVWEQSKSCEDLQIAEQR